MQSTENNKNIDFDTFYQKEIASSIQKIETKRVELDNKNDKLIPFIQGLLAIVLAGLSYFFVGLFESYFAGVFVFLFGLIFILALKKEIKNLLVGKKNVNKLNTEYKSEIIRKIVLFFGKDFGYYPNETITDEELKKSDLFDIKYNTKVKTDDIIRGKLNGNDFLIADVNMVSSLQSYDDNLDVGSGNRIGLDEGSNQNFNGLLVRMKVNIQTGFEGRAFILPKSMAEEGSQETLKEMKFLRDKSMSMEEQRSHNLKAFNPLLRAYHWKPEYAQFTGELERYEVIRDTKKNNEEYYFYTNNEITYQNLLENKALKNLQEHSFAQKDSEDKVVEYKIFFQSIDPNQLDKAMEKQLIYAIHSGYVWVLIPSFTESFELDLSHLVDKEKVKDIFENLQLALMSISVFVED